MPRLAKSLLLAAVLAAVVCATPDRTTTYTVLAGDTFNINHWVAGLFDSEFSTTFTCNRYATWQILQGPSMSSLERSAYGWCTTGAVVEVGKQSVRDAVDVVLELTCTNVSQTGAPLTTPCMGNSTIKLESSLGNLRSGAIFFAITIFMAVIFVIILLTIYAGAIQGFKPMPTGSAAIRAGEIAAAKAGSVVGGSEQLVEGRPVDDIIKQLHETKDKVWWILAHIIVSIPLLTLSFFPDSFIFSLIIVLWMINAAVTICRLWWRDFCACCPCCRAVPLLELDPSVLKVLVAMEDEHEDILGSMKCVVAVLGVLSFVSLILSAVYVLPGLIVVNLLFILIAGIYACRVFYRLSMWGDVGAALDPRNKPDVQFEETRPMTAV